MINIANPAVVTAAGEGLTSGTVGQLASFVISAGQNAAVDDITVRIKCKCQGFVSRT